MNVATTKDLTEGSVFNPHFVEKVVTPFYVYYKRSDWIHGFEK